MIFRQECSLEVRTGPVWVNVSLPSGKNVRDSPPPNSSYTSKEYISPCFRTIFECIPDGKSPDCPPPPPPPPPLESYLVLFHFKPTLRLKPP